MQANRQTHRQTDDNRNISHGYGGGKSRQADLNVSANAISVDIRPAYYIYKQKTDLITDADINLPAFPFI